MALLTDDQDIKDVRMWIDIGGNGDYYINLMEMQKDVFDDKGELVQTNVLTSTRISTSGGNASHEIKMAVGELYRVMQKAGLNRNPLGEE